jgi:phospholipid/cholesterol/gamma-HCH transport system substrate-binding protein
MANRKTKFFVGLFMAGGISIAIVAIIWLGMSRIFEKGSYYAVYFDESVQGLSVDSPVKYRGVSIGRVEKIRVAPDSRLIEVILIIESEIKAENDMVAQLKVVGITGSMFIELDRHKAGDESRTPELRFPTEHPVFATRPSDISELFRGIDDIVQKLNMLDIGGISDRIKVTLEHIDQSVVSADVADLSAKLKKAIDDIDRDVADLSTKLKKTIDDIDRSVVDLDLPGISSDVKTALGSLNQDLDPQRWHKILSGIEETINGLKGATDNVNALLENTKGTVGETEAGIVSINRHLGIIGRNLEQSSINLNLLLENLAANPSQVLFSEPPPRRLPE